MRAAANSEDRAFDGTTVSVVTPTHCKKELLAATLNSLSAQTYPSRLLEVVVVDDCSGDDTWDFLARIETAFRLRPLLHEVNKGRAAARNTALNDATGTLVLFLDDDMRAHPGLVEAHVRCHKAHPGSVVIGNAVTAPELGTSNTLRYLDTRGVHKLSPGTSVPARYLLTNNSSVSRSALVKVGMFDEAFRNYGFEDTELAFRLEDAGLSFRYCPDAVAYHIHYHSLDELLRKRYESAKGSLDYLLHKFPDRAAELSVDVLLPRAPGDGPGLHLRKAIVGLAMSRPFVALARAIADAPFMGELTYRAIDFLIADCYRRGLADARPARAAASGLAE
jgi:glycosyltransferase involved in cell wall biosynthesis